jgi:REP element-mobilizing transposase RayT
MPQSYTCLHYHLVFATRLREPVITPEIRPQLWDYLGGVVRGLGGIPLAVGGVADHVHLLATLRQQPALAEVMREVKARSSKWAHETHPEAASLWWQNGYGAFTVSHSGLDAVREYILNQEERHRTRGFEEEFRALLRKHEIEFDEDGLWV